MSSLGRLGRGFRNTTAMALGLVPVAAMALGGNDVTTAVAPGCGAVVQPFGAPLEPPAETLKGAPYSGVGTTEVITTLADGNRITRTNTMHYFRDGAGRMRTEYQLATIGPFVPEDAQSIVTITDPVAERRYVLHPGLKRADVFKLNANGSPQPAAGAIFMGGAFAVNGSFGSVGESSAPSLVQSTGTRARMRSPLPNRGTDRTPKMMAPGFAAAAPTAETERGVAVSGAPAGMPPPNFDVMYVNPHAVGTGCGSATGNAPKKESIGERRIEGLKVTGSRLEFTIDAGAVGNEQPITVRTDQWFSPDLGVVVSSTHSDPMMGETTYRLEQINRVEPDESLFVVPQDYTKNSVGF